MKTILFSLGFFLLINTGLQAQEINWVNLEQAEKNQKSNPEKHILVTFYTDWCGYCRKLNTTTFRESEVVKTINENYIPVRFNAEDKESVKFKGNTYDFVQGGRRGLHSFAYWTLNGRPSYPTIAIIDKSGKTIKLINGYQSPKQLLSYLN